MMHAAPFKNGKLGELAMPYVKTLIPGAIAILGLAAICEIVFHMRHGATGEHGIDLFWMHFDVGILPLLIAGAVTLGGYLVAKRFAPELRAAWDSANTLPALNPLGATKPAIDPDTVNPVAEIQGEEGKA